MKTQHYILMSLTLALTACANDDVIQADGSDEIKFEVMTDNALSRATYLHGSKENFTSEDAPEMYLSAYRNSGVASYGYAPYIINDKLKYNNTTGSWAFENNKSYVWPVDEQKLSFYALHVCNGGASSNLTTIMKYGKYGSETDNYGTSPNYYALKALSLDLSKNAETQEDILYACTLSINKDSNNGIVSLCFDHALSAIQFIVSNGTEAYSYGYNLYIEVKDITICNLYSSGTLYFRSVATPSKTPYLKWMYGKNEDTGEYKKGDFNIFSDRTGDDEYDYLMPRFMDDEAPQVSYDGKKTFMLLPQTFDTGTYDSAAGTWKGAYVKLSCRLYNIIYPFEFYDKVSALSSPSNTDIHNLIVNGDSDHSSYGSLIFGSKGADQTDKFGDLYIPLPALSGGWTAGKKYIYYLTFGGSGYNAYDANGNKTLFYIFINQTHVDTWPTDSDNDNTLKGSNANQQ